MFYLYFSVVAFAWAILGLALHMWHKNAKWQQVGLVLFQAAAFIFIWIMAGAKIVRIP